MEIITKENFENYKKLYGDYVILFHILKKYEKLEEVTESAISEICECHWKIKRKRKGLEKYTIACCRNKRKIVGVIRISRWKDSKTESGRSCIEVGKISHSTQARYLGRELAKEINLGRYPVRYITELD